MILLVLCVSLFMQQSAACTQSHPMQGMSLMGFEFVTFRSKNAEQMDTCEMKPTPQSSRRIVYPSEVKFFDNDFIVSEGWYLQVQTNNYPEIINEKQAWHQANNNVTPITIHFLSILFPVQTNIP